MVCGEQKPDAVAGAYAYRAGGRIPGAVRENSSCYRYKNGCAFFVRTEAIREVGLLNERFFYKYEDVDWSLRFFKAGYETLYAPEAKVWHKVSQASGGAVTIMVVF